MTNRTERRGRDRDAEDAGRSWLAEAPDRRRFEELASAERVLLPVRWAAVAFAVYLVMTYSTPDLVPPGITRNGFALAAVLALTNGAAAVAVRRIRTVRAIVWLVSATLVADLSVVAGFVWLYTFDEASVHVLLFFVLPAEAALKFRLFGALGMWAAITTIYTARQIWAAATYGYAFSAPSIVFRMGILLLVSVILGLFARRLCRRTDELGDALAQLQREERWRTALIDMLAHDFRSPVGSAISALQVIDQQLEELAVDDVRHLVAVAVRQNRRGLALADDILTLARARQDHLELHREDVEIAPIARRAATASEHDAGPVDIDTAAGLHAVIDPARLEQVLANLLSNARRYGQPPIAVSARPLDDLGVEICVSDAGTGVPREHRDALFTQFSRGPHRDSVGLGLWLVDVIATAHGGGATYATIAGRPTFTVTLPGPSDDPRRPGHAGPEVSPTGPTPVPGASGLC